MEATKPPRREDVECGRMWNKLRLSSIVGMGGGVGAREGGGE